MRLNSASGQFVFNLPSDFITDEISATYIPFLEKNFVQYTNIVDYLSSTIKEVTVPGLSIEAPAQIRKRGKEVNYKPATNVQDILTSRKMQITFREVDQGLNYWMLFDIFIKHYLDTEYIRYVAPFMITSLDINRDAMYQLTVKEVILINQDSNKFAYNDLAFDEKTFTIELNFNWFELEFLLNKKKVLNLDNVDPVIQIIPQNPDDFK